MIYLSNFQEMKMASIDRHQYSEDIRKGAAKFVNNLNLDNKISTASTKLNSSAAKHQLLQKLGPTKNTGGLGSHSNSVVGRTTSHHKSGSGGGGVGGEGQVYILTSPLGAGGAAKDPIHLNTAATRNGVSPASGNHFRNPSISAIANFALGGDLGHVNGGPGAGGSGGGSESQGAAAGQPASSLDSQLNQGYEAQLGAARGPGGAAATAVTPLSRLPGQGLTLAGGHQTAAGALPNFSNSSGAKNGGGSGPLVAAAPVPASNTVSSILASKIFARQATAAAENSDKLLAKGYQQQQQQQLASSSPAAAKTAAASLLEKRRLSAERDQQQQESLRRFQPGSYPQASQAETMASGGGNNPQIYENIESIVPPPPPPYMGYHHIVTTESLSRWVYPTC
jgi:hypothetical protein